MQRELFGKTAWLAARRPHHSGWSQLKSNEANRFTQAIMNTELVVLATDGRGVDRDYLGHKAATAGHTSTNQFWVRCAAFTVQARTIEGRQRVLYAWVDQGIVQEFSHVIARQLLVPEQRLAQDSLRLRRRVLRRLRRRSELARQAESEP